MYTAEFTGLDEAQVTELIEHAQACGYTYDEDITALYGNGWEIVGVRVTETDCARNVATYIAENFAPVWVS